MSSTNRSDARLQHVSDYYITPIDKISEFLIEFNRHESVFASNVQVLDPCAGGDTKNGMSYPIALNLINSGLHITTNDIREDSGADIKSDYLELDCKDKFDVIITNPPFNISKDIIEKALQDVKDNGFVIMLLRLNYFGGKVRQDLWKTHMPKYCFVHNKRISFTDNGKTDSIEYCHMVWQKGYYPEFTELKVLMEDN